MGRDITKEEIKAMLKAIEISMKKMVAFLESKYSLEINVS